MPRSTKSARILQVVNERSVEIYRCLVRDNKSMAFLPARSPEDAPPENVGEESGEIIEMAQPEEETVNEQGVPNRYLNNRLQTRLTPVGLQKRLLDLYYDARTLEEEQGVNILFLALGTLRWVDQSNKANVRYAPLVLVPVALERGNAGERFKLRWRQEDPASNLSLELYVDRVHGLKMPAFETGDDFDFTAYVDEVAETVATKEGWGVAPDDITLGFFSFAKFLMYRDLDPEVWPRNARISEHPLIRSLVSDGFSGRDDLIPEDSKIDQHLAPSDMLHIVDSDSSQTLAIHEVRRHRNIVIQGPPGTGKSQTIANIIASAVADGKTVLFVAEKMAALEVVKRRLDMAGVGDACLELHSNKANKREVLQELKRTWELGFPKGDIPTALDGRLAELRARLNGHADRMNCLYGPAGLTPCDIVGHLTRLKQDGQAPNDIKLVAPEKWTKDDVRERFKVLSELIERVSDIGLPAKHVWRGIGVEIMLPPNVDRLVVRLRSLAEQFDDLRSEQTAVATTLETAPAESLATFGGHAYLARRIAGAPALPQGALGDSHWQSHPTEIAALLLAGAEYADAAEKLRGRIQVTAWSIDVAPAQKALRDLPDGFSLEVFEHVGRFSELWPHLIEEAAKLTSLLELPVPTTAAAIDLAVQIGERVAVAPDASLEAFLAAEWENGAERARDLATTIKTLEACRADIGTKLSETAWSMDLRQARATLATHGTGFFKIFSGDWRKANRLVKSVLGNPQTPLPEILSLLDALARGQTALETIHVSDQFGRAVFGSDWRGDKSVSGPFLALADWMRTLRGLGSKPRLVASQRPDRSEIGGRTARVQALVTESKALLLAVWDNLASRPGLLFGNALNSERADITEVGNRLMKVHAAHSLCRSIMTPVPSALPDCLHLLDNLARGQAAARAVSEGEALGSAAFGSEWRSASSDWSALRAAADWIAINLDVHMLASRVSDRAALLKRADEAVANGKSLSANFGSLLDELRFDRMQVFGDVNLAVLPIQQFIDHIAAWLSAQELLSKWVAYRNRAAYGRSLGIAEIVDQLHDGRLQPADAIPNFEMSYYEAVFNDLARALPEVAQFDGALHGRAVRDFADFDRQRIKASALEVVRAHHRRIPPANEGAVGPLGVLRSEIARKRGHMPIRQLIQRAAPAVQALKPVLMMSPLSIAQFLPPGAFTFDLVVMDEASQIQPVDALGAIARSRQVVVVGDPHQLPPTAFFAKMTGSAEDDEEEGAKLADIESILGLFTARGLPTRMLRWHYRSRHQSLIAVSNQQFYENKLFIVPSPHSADAGMGLRFNFIENGIFETGTTRTNPIEAKHVARAIVDHAIHHPDRSLGVVAFSAAQRRAIQDQLELLRRQLPPEHEAFFQAHLSEPFFIKNLENVQGDERDVIFISVGYGPTAPGQKPPMRFGPLGLEGGERRLNVLISRAKRRCEVFSSIMDEHIDPEFARTPSRKGVFAFKLFLHFARTGRMAMATSTGRDHDSIFEEQVAKALRARGHNVTRQVGIAGFFVDLAISDSDLPGRYVLGIECDGASYHASRSARDRDRLRQAVLEDHGWIIHRIWSTDWFNRPREQLECVESAIMAAKAQLAERGKRDRPLDLNLSTIIDREPAPETTIDGGETEPYVEASPAKPARLSCEIHEAPTGTLTAMAEEVVRIESPVHIDEVVSRIREAWGLKRAGGRIQDAIEKAVAVALRQNRLEKDGKFLSVPGVGMKVRDRSEVQSATLRRPEMLPPTELRQAALQIVASNFGATDDQVVQAVSRVLGFKATSTPLRVVIQKAVDRGVADQLFKRQDDLIVLGPAAPEDFVISQKTPVEKLIAEGEHEHLASLGSSNLVRMCQLLFATQHALTVRDEASLDHFSHR